MKASYFYRESGILHGHSIRISNMKDIGHKCFAQQKKKRDFDNRKKLTVVIVNYKLSLLTTPDSLHFELYSFQTDFIFNLIFSLQPKKF